MWNVKAIATALVTAVFSGAVCGQTAGNYPDKPIRLVVPYPPGGSPDLNARFLSSQISARSNWKFVVDNRPGAASLVGSDFVKNSAPDGYTLLHNSSAYVVTQALAPKRNLNTLRDFVPISNTTTTSGSMMNVKADFPAKDLKQFIAIAKAAEADGRPLAYGSPGIGNGLHLVTELFAMGAGIKLLHVPHSGTPQLVTALQQGQIATMFLPGTAMQGYLAKGQVRALAVTTKRLEFAPDIPTLAELGIPGFPIPGAWSGWFAPAKLPRDIVMKIHGEIVAALQEPKFKEFLKKTSGEGVGSTPEEFISLIQSELKRYADIARAAKIELED